VCMCVYKYIWVNIHSLIVSSVLAGNSMYIYIYTCACVCTCVCVYVCVYIYVGKYTFTTSQQRVSW